MLWRTAEIDQRRHLDERDRPDQREAVKQQHTFEPARSDVRLQRPARPPVCPLAKSSSQTMAPVAAIDRVDLSESRA